LHEVDDDIVERVLAVAEQILELKQIDRIIDGKIRHGG
jgi:hypothetical protein